MAYDLTTVNASNFGTIVTTVGNLTNGWFSRMVMLTIFVLIGAGYLKARPDDISGAFAVASWISFVMAVVGWLMTLVDDWSVGIALALTIVASLILFVNRE